jgi:hypothetical protein
MKSIAIGFCGYIAIAAASAVSPCAQASIISTGGTINFGGNYSGSSSSATVHPGDGSFNLASTTIITYVEGPGQPLITGPVTTAQVSGATSSTQLSLSAVASTKWDYGFQSYTGSVGGNIGFDVTEASILQFVWTDSTVGSHYQSPEWLQLSAPNGSIVLGCVGTNTVANPIGGGCQAGSNPDLTTHGPLALYGQVVVGPGQYSLAFQVSSGTFARSSDNGSLSISLMATPVPIPAALPLFLSALGFLSAARFRRKRP